MKTATNNTPPCPRLIEVALPVREISAESVRDKNVNPAHISRLHMWWARRPLPASRAIIFASLVPDPDDPRCPTEFRLVVEQHLKTDVPEDLKIYRSGGKIHRNDDPYHPYEGIQDTLRNRLLTFIAKWSPETLAFETGQRQNRPKPKQLLDDCSLVKWETSDPGNTRGTEILRIARELVKVAQNGNTPTVLDPFAGGGAIPLEAGRLGCHAIANDYNPVAHLLLRATCEMPQKYGKPGTKNGGGQMDVKSTYQISLSTILNTGQIEFWTGYDRKSNTYIPPGKMAAQSLRISGREQFPAPTRPVKDKSRYCVVLFYAASLPRLH